MGHFLPLEEQFGKRHFNGHSCSGELIPSDRPQDAEAPPLPPPASPPEAGVSFNLERGFGTNSHGCETTDWAV